MTKDAIGFLHPGAMGISLAAAAKKSGHAACWVSSGRSEETRKRAEEHGLTELQSLDQLCSSCPIIVSVCPPHAAKAVAEEVLAAGFTGTYLDANAISPEHVKEIAGLLTGGGIAVVDGGIIGPPAWTPGKTWLYLAGQRAAPLAECFSAGPLACEVIGAEIGKASALKMCFAANSKGTAALLAAILAVAEQLGVRQDLENHWSRGDSDYAAQTHARVAATAPKAWRFVGEMDEIAATFAAAGLPADFHRAAGAIYQQMSSFKNAATAPDIDAILAALAQPNK